MIRHVKYQTVIAMITRVIEDISIHNISALELEISGLQIENGCPEEYKYFLISLRCCVLLPPQSC
jgi:hypothetical protein